MNLAAGSRGAGRPPVSPEALLGRGLNGAESKNAPERLFCAGPMRVPVPSPRVSVIGSRDASAAGLADAGEVAGALAEGGAVVVSGLARGIDAAAHRAAIRHGGRTIAVIGTPLDRAYPRENAGLQEEIARDHLVVSQYPAGRRTVPRDFALRNRTMALISDAAVIVEAGDSSGALHHGWESIRLGRPLFVCKAAADDPGLEWPKKMIGYGATRLGDAAGVLGRLPPDAGAPDLLSRAP